MSTPDTESPCPNCSAPVPAGNVLCTACGYNLQTGGVIEMKVAEPEAEPDPELAPVPALASEAAAAPVVDAETADSAAAPAAAAGSSVLGALTSPLVIGAFVGISLVVAAGLTFWLWPRPYTFEPGDKKARWQQAVDESPLWTCYLTYRGTQPGKKPYLVFHGDSEAQRGDDLREYTFRVLHPQTRNGLAVAQQTFRPKALDKFVDELVNKAAKDLMIAEGRTSAGLVSAFADQLPAADAATAGQYLEILRDIGPPAKGAIPAISGCLKRTDAPAVRRLAAHAAGTILPPDSAPDALLAVIKPAATDSDAEVRKLIYSGVVALGAKGIDIAIAGLASPASQADAATALIALRWDNQPAIPALCKALEATSSDTVRRQAALALAASEADDAEANDLLRRLALDAELSEEIRGYCKLAYAMRDLPGSTWTVQTREHIVSTFGFGTHTPTPTNKRHPTRIDLIFRRHGIVDWYSHLKDIRDQGTWRLDEQKLWFRLGQDEFRGDFVTFAYLKGQGPNIPLPGGTQEVSFTASRNVSR